MSGYDFICFDTESAQGRLGSRYVEELIEISVVGTLGDTLFYHRFKPERLRRWSPSVHKITPDMVKRQPRVKEFLPHLQSIFDMTDYIVGFSLIDDFKALERAGIKNLSNKKTVELRYLYWYCIGRHDNTPFYSGPGLSKCAENMGIPVIAEGVHTASGDTLVTYNLFLALMEQFLISEGILNKFEKLDIDKIGSMRFKEYVELALRRVAEAKYEYDRRCAAGYVHLVSEDSGVKFVPSLEREYNKGKVIMTIPVNARRRALYELETIFAKRRSKALRKVFYLKEPDLARLAAYHNEYDGREQLYQKLTALRRADNNV